MGSAGMMNPRETVVELLSGLGSLIPMALRVQTNSKRLMVTTIPAAKFNLSFDALP